MPPQRRRIAAFSGSCSKISSSKPITPFAEHRIRQGLNADRIALGGVVVDRVGTAMRLEDAIRTLRCALR
jgi:hypothetical protein